MRARSLPALALVCLAAWLGAAVAAVPELPRAYLDTTYAPPSGSTITVGAGGNLQSAINTARPGDTIVLQAGAIFTGPFVLPDKGSSTQWIYVRSSAYDRLPAPGNRVSPADAANMPVIVGTGSPVVALATQGAAHHYRFVGIEFRPGPGLFSRGLIRFGTAEESAIAQLPHNLVLDRCYIHGDAALGGRRGVALNSATSAVIDSYLSDWKEVGADSQAIMGWNGPGPFRIANNYLEGAGENVMFGGADPRIAGLVPSDIEIRGNRFAKPVAWRPMQWTVKNLLELKNARRILVEGNILEYDWEAAQNFAINIKSTNQDGTAPWSVTRDFTFRHNIVAHVPSAIKICGIVCDGTPTAQGSAYLLQNNIFDDVNPAAWGGQGVFLMTTTPTPDLTVNHNTVIHQGPTYLGGDGGERRNTGFEFTDNIVQRGSIGFKGSGTGEGTGTLDAFFPRAVFRRNAIVGASASRYPSDNYFPGTSGSIGFVDALRSDYRLAPGSSLRNAAGNGRDVGADVTAVSAATACAANGQCGSPRALPVVNPFTFTNVDGVTPGSMVTSNVITIAGTGLSLPATISVSDGGSYSIGCNQRLITTTSMIRAGETVCIRYRAPHAANATTTTTLTVDGVSATFRSTTGPVVPRTAPNTTGLWWNPDESGWGVNFAQQGEFLFGTLFNYDAARRPMWLVMSEGTWQPVPLDDFSANDADLGTYAGLLYRATGPPFNATPFTPVGAENLTEVGEMRVAFGSAGTKLEYTVDGTRVTKSIRKQVFGPRPAECSAAAGSRAGAPNVQDLWWSPAEAGWGLSITHQADVLFATLFTYGADGNGLWLVMSDGLRQRDGSYLGDLYRTSGSPFDAEPFEPLNDVRRVGTMRLRFADGQAATLEYSVDGLAVTKEITRQVFGNPPVECVS